jgi:hypothetical protein
MKTLEDEGAVWAKTTDKNLNGGTAPTKAKAGTKRKAPAADGDDQDELNAPATKKPAPGKTNAAGKKGTAKPKPVKKGESDAEDGNNDGGDADAAEED